MHRNLAVLTAAVVLAACGGGDKSGPTPPAPAAVATVELSQQSVTMNVGDVLTLTATAKDASGRVLTGRTETWASSNPLVATVGQGAVTALAPGTATISVTIEQKTAQAVITVQSRGVASVVVSPQHSWVQVGATVTLSVVLRDATGAILTKPVQWTSSDQAKATVTNGVVTGLAPGVVTISATSDGKVGTAAVTVTLLAPPTITSISPAILTPGSTATITGTNFSADPSEDTVTIAGAAATVTAASTTQLTVSVPANLPCVATAPHPVVVLTGGGPVTRDHPVQSAAQRTLAVGEELLALDEAAMRCNELTPGGSRYLVSVFNTSRVPTNLAAVDIVGASGARTVAGVPSFGWRSAIAPLATPAWPGTSGGSLGVSPTSVAALRSVLRSAHRDHLARLERDRAVIRNLAARGLVGSRLRSALRASRSVSASGASASTFSGPVPTTVGQETTIKYPSRTSCATSTPVTAVVRYVGQHTIVLEDKAGPLAGQLNADLEHFGQLFDNTIFPIEDNFGDLAALDAELQNPGKVIMLFTPLVNAQGTGLLGFVTAWDFAPATEPGYAGSNETKIFYARTALRLTQQNENSVSFDERPLWRLAVPPTITHETKHIVSFAERISRGAAVPEESWLEEATAQIAAELYGRSFWSGVTWKSNASYAGTMYCEVRNVFAPANFPNCSAYEYDVSDNFFNLYDYYQQISSKSFLSRASDDGTIYGSAWLFVRWLADQYGGASERTFFRSLVQEGTLTGVDNVTAKTGTGFAELVGNFTLSLIADDYPNFAAANGAKYTVPSWNTRDMFLGMSRDFRDVVPFPLAKSDQTFGNFTVSVPGIAGGSAAYIELSGPNTGRQLINLSALPAGTPIRLGIVRVQ